jgi:tetratricopeptide (TPR) repeat protein
VNREAGHLDRAARLLREAEGVLSTAPQPRPPVPGPGRFAAAVKHAQRAIALQEDRQILDPFFNDLVLAQACNGYRDFNAARAAAERALRIAIEKLAELKHSVHVEQAHLELGVALAGKGDVQAGRQELEQALVHLRASVGPEAASTRRALAQLKRLGS